MVSLISLLLLLGISAASAASDADFIAQDSVMGDISAIEDIDNVDDNIIDANVLSDGEDPNPDDTNPADSGTGENGGESADETGTPSSIEASNETYSYGDDIAINVSVKDNQSNAINITADDILVSYSKEGEDNYTDMNFTLNNESQIIFEFLPHKTLPIGNYDVKIQFNKTIDNIPYFLETFSALNIIKSGTTINASDVKLSLGNEVIIPLHINLESNKTLNVNASSIIVWYLVDGEDQWEFNCTNETDGDYITNSIKLSNFNMTEVGNYTIRIEFIGTESANPSNISITLHILENNTIDASDSIEVNNSTKNVTIPFKISNTNITVIPDPETGENVTNVNVTNLTVTKEDLKLILKYDNGTENISSEITDFELIGNEGNYTINFTTDLEFTSEFYQAELIIIYKNGTSSEANKTINLKAFIDAYIDPIVSEADYQFGEFKFKLVDAETGEPLVNYNVSLSGFYFYKISESGGMSIMTSKSFTSDENGFIVFNDTFMSPISTFDTSALYNGFSSLSVGTHNAIFTGEGILKFTNVTKITVKPIQAKIIASNITQEYGKNLTYRFQLVHAETGEPIKVANVQFIINGTNINANRNGTTNLTGHYTSPDLVLTGGNYNLTLKSIDSNLICSAVKKTITIKPKATTLTASNRTIYYNSDYSAIVKLKDKKTGKAVANAYVLITVYTSSTKYTNFLGKTNKNGQIYLSTPLSVGKHKIVFQTADNSYTASKITRYLTVKKASAKFTAPKVSTYYKSGKVFKIKLTNTKNKKAIYYGTVNIKVYISKNKYYNYTGTTDSNGSVQLKVTLKPGTYKVVISGYDKGYSAKALTSQIKVSKSPIKMAPTSLKVKKGKYFKVKVTSTKTKKVLSGIKVKVKVYTGKKYKTYTIKTNKKGIASLKISQKVGKHKVVLSPGSPTYYSAKALTKTLTVTK